MKLTEKMQNVIDDAYSNGGSLFRSNNDKYKQQTMNRLKALGLIKQCQNWTMWTLTDLGKSAAEQKKQSKGNRRR